MFYPKTEIKIETGDFVRILEKYEYPIGGCVAHIAGLHAQDDEAYCVPLVNPPSNTWVPFKYLQIIRKPYKIRERVFWCENGVVWSGHVLKIYENGAKYKLQYDKRSGKTTKVDHENLARSMKGVSEQE